MRTIFLVLALTSAASYVVSVEIRIRALTSIEEHAMQTTWSSGGMRREVTTLRLEGESTKDWRERHFEAVRVAQAIHPPE